MAKPSSGKPFLVFGNGAASFSVSLELRRTLWNVRRMTREAPRTHQPVNLWRAVVIGVLLCASLPLRAGPTPTPGTPARDDAGLPPRVHDPSTIIRCNGEYWLFCTGRGIGSFHSHDRISWTVGPSVFPTLPAWIGTTFPDFRGTLWAPDVLQVNGRYFLYYAVSGIWGQNASAIGLTTCRTLDPTDPLYGWTDLGVIVQSSKADDFNAIDPSVFRDGSDRLWMAFGSFWNGIRLTELDPTTGKRKAPGSPMYHVAYHREIEAPCLTAHDGVYYLFVNWGLCCRGVRSTYEIRVGRSRNPTGPYIDRAGLDMMRDGGSIFLQSDGRFIGPGQPGISQEGGRWWISYHFYDGDRDGRFTLAVRELKWDAQGWPVPGPMLTPAATAGTPSGRPPAVVR